MNNIIQTIVKLFITGEKKLNEINK